MIIILFEELRAPTYGLTVRFLLFKVDHTVQLRDLAWSTRYSMYILWWKIYELLLVCFFKVCHIIVSTSVVNVRFPTSKNYKVI
jgi:hypothetical protein